MVSIRSREPSAKQVQNSEKFIKAAREAGCSEDEAVFDENLKNIARHKPPEKAKKTPK